MRGNYSYVDSGNDSYMLIKVYKNLHEPCLSIADGRKKG